MIGSGDTLLGLTFGHKTEKAAIGRLDRANSKTARPGTWNQPLVARLQAYAEGAPDEFRDVPIDPGPTTDFQRRVVRFCRQIPFGHTITYGQLAAKAGSPRAARAVGACMAANPIPLIVPCHRVISAGGSLGGYSAPGGIATKRRLLALEAGES